MDKLKMETPNLTEQNIDRIAELFPGVITEKRDENGKLTRAVNFEVLKQKLSPEVLAGDEAYEFTWVGKKASIVEANKPIRKTLRPCKEESKDWDTTENLYIEGDNLDVLKLLQESYLSKVKMIYIDPPYNTGHDFIYNDRFEMDEEEYNEQIGLFDEEQNKNFRENNESNPRFHSDWCSMMYARLMVARSLLSDEGVIFISIDDNEAVNLIKICSEILGESCFVADIAWQRTYAPRNDSNGISSEKEHLIVFSKSPNWMPKKLPRTEEMNSKYKSIDGDPVLWRSDNPCAPGASTHQGMVYGIQHPFTGKMLYPSAGAHWRYQQNEMLRIMSGWGSYVLEDIHDESERAAICGVDDGAIRENVKAIVLSEPLSIAQEHAKEVYKRGNWPLYFFSNQGLGGIAKKTYLNEDNGKVVTNFWSHSEVGNTDEAKKEILSLFNGSAPFDTPKPIRLLDRIISISTDKEDTILDFFSGSGTAAHAVMKKNAEDGGQRSYILVQLPEQSKSKEYKNICEIGKERIRRAGAKIKAEAGLMAQNLDTGFRVFKLDETNMKDVFYSAEEYTQTRLDDMISNIKEDRTDLDLLYGCLLEWGLPLSLPHVTEAIEGCNVHTVNGGDLIACFDEDIPESVIKKIAERKPLRVVFRDSSFTSSPEKINVTEIFKLITPGTSVRVL